MDDYDSNFLWKFHSEYKGYNIERAYHVDVNGCFLCYKNYYRCIVDRYVTLHGKTLKQIKDEITGYIDYREGKE